MSSRNDSPKWDNARIARYLNDVADALFESLEADEKTAPDRLKKWSEFLANPNIETRKAAYGLSLPFMLDECMNGYAADGPGIIGQVLGQMPPHLLPTLFPLLENEMGDLAYLATEISAAGEEIAWGYDRFGTERELPSCAQMESDLGKLTTRARLLVEHLREKAIEIAQEIVLHRDDLKILTVLSQQAATVNQYDMEAKSGLSRKTISDRLARLRDAGLVWRPNGPRGGDAITTDGRKAIERAAH